MKKNYTKLTIILTILLTILTVNFPVNPEKNNFFSLVVFLSWSISVWYLAFLLSMSEKFITLINKHESETENDGMTDFKLTRKLTLGSFITMHIAFFLFQQPATWYNWILISMFLMISFVLIFLIGKSFPKIITEFEPLSLCNFVIYSFFFIPIICWYISSWMVNVSHYVSIFIVIIGSFFSVFLIKEKATDFVNYLARIYEKNPTD